MLTSCSPTLRTVRDCRSHTSSFPSRPPVAASGNLGRQEGGVTPRSEERRRATGGCGDAAGSTRQDSHRQEEARQSTSGPPGPTSAAFLPGKPCGHDTTTDGLTPGRGPPLPPSLHAPPESPGPARSHSSISSGRHPPGRSQSRAAQANTALPQNVTPEYQAPAP